MTAKDIFMKTLPFCWSKLGLGLLNIVICVVLFAILMGIALLFNSEGVAAVMIIVWFVLIGIVNFVINHYFAYLVKAGHVAVIAQTFKDGRVPDNCVSVGKAMVKDRFGTANAYFAIDKLVSGAVKQLQRTLGRITDSLLGSLPGADSVKSATNFFLNISLGYIDECCLSYTFYNRGQNAYKSACDGVVIYAQNWKHLLKNAAMTAQQKMRTLIVYEAYQVFVRNRQVKPVTLCRNIAHRLYDTYLQKAETDEEAAEMCRACNIAPGKKRDFCSLSSDVQALNYIVNMLENPTPAIERAKVEDASDWLVREGMKMGNANSVAKGAELKMRLYKDFDEKEQEFDKTAQSDINISGDVSIIKADRQNFSIEEKRKLAKRFGGNIQEVEDLIQKSNGEYETAPMETLEDEDFFVMSEED